MDDGSLVTAGAVGSYIRPRAVTVLSVAPGKPLQMLGENGQPTLIPTEDATVRCT